METFAEKFKAARKAAGMKTQQAVTEQMDIPRRTVEDWESGRMSPPSYVQKLVQEKLESMKQEKE